MAASAVCQAIAQHLADGEGDKSVLAHVGRNGKWTVSIQAHQRAAKDRGQHCRHKAGTDRNAGIREDGRIHHHDVRHGSEGRQPGN